MIDDELVGAGAVGAPVLRLAVQGAEVQSELRALYEWLTREEGLRGYLELRNQPILPGQMGGVVDVLVVTLGAGGAGTVLARSLSTWLTQRHADITVAVKAPDGREVTVDVRRARDPEAVIREVGALITAAEK
jgi:hypothetical protein